MKEMLSNPFTVVNSPDFLASLRHGGAESKKAFNRLVKETHDRLFSYVRRHLSPPEDCLDVVQETYLAVHRGLSKFEGKSKLTTWIYSLAHHKLCDRLSEKSRMVPAKIESLEALLSANPEETALSEASFWDVPPDRIMARDSAVGLMAEAVEALPPHFRAIYDLRDVEGLSGEDAAAALGISPANARLQLHRARKQIVEWVLEKMGRSDILGMIVEKEVKVENWGKPSQ